MRCTGSKVISALALATAVGALGKPASALDGEDARKQAASTLAGVRAKFPEIRRAASVPAPRSGAAKRVAAGDILLRNHSYEGAIRAFSQVLELQRQGKAPQAAAADAELLLAEAYFLDGQLLSARRHYVATLERPEMARQGELAGRALGRLVDVALRTKRSEVLAEAGAFMAKLPQSDATGALAYARGKVLYAQGQYVAAKRELRGVPTDASCAHQSQYLLGVVLVKEAAAAPATDEASPSKNLTAARGRFNEALEQFRQVTEMPAANPKQRHVVDLAWMAIGRLHYESETFLDAADAYSQLGRESEEFPVMLYELAWTYARLGDYQRAQRALEVLSITHPENLDWADGSLLRGDLLLRSGRFDEALKLYKGVRRRFDPVRRALDDFLESTTDPAVYYDELVADRMEQPSFGADLPPLVVEWAREEAGNDRAFAVIDDVSRSHLLIREARRMALELSALLGSGTRVKAFAEIRAPIEKTLGLLNQLTLARAVLVRALDDLAEDASAELLGVQAQRGKLSKAVEALPITSGDFARRDYLGEARWNELSQALQRLTLEVDRLQAITNALKRVVRQPGEHAIETADDARERFEEQIVANERDLEVYRERVSQLRQVVAMGKVQVGFGDQRYAKDGRVRDQFQRLVEHEFTLAAGSQAGEDAQAYARSVAPLLEQLDSATQQLRSAHRSLTARAKVKAAEVQRQIEKEQRNLGEYAAHLDMLDQQARLLVGELALQNFYAVRDRLKSIVLRADVGDVQQAWEVREEQRIRVQALQRERSREEQNLNDELREVLDDEEDML